MQNLKILNKKQTKEILSLIKKQFGAEFKSDYAFLKNEKGKIYLINKDISKINLDKIRINNLGLYFAQVYTNEIRLSIEGSQLIGPLAKKNILELNETQTKEWMSGSDLDIDEDYSGFVLICRKYTPGFQPVDKVRHLVLEKGIFPSMLKNRLDKVSYTPNMPPIYDGRFLTKHKKDFLGCGKVRNKKVFNFVGKARRLNI